MAYRAAFALVMVTSVATAAQAVTVDHNDVDAVSDITAITQATMNIIGQQKWFFSHASVGGNMIDGMRDLNTANSTRYPLVVASTGYNGTLQRADFDDDDDVDMSDFGVFQRCLNGRRPVNPACDD